MERIRVSILVGLALVAAGGRAFGRSVWAASPYDHGGLVINVKEIDYRSNKMWFKLQFINNTEKDMGVNPDQLQLKLQDGRTITRVKGMFDKLSHGAVLIPPGAGELLPFEYLVGEEPKKAILSLNTGITVGGKPTKFPEYVARPSGAEWSAAAYNHNRVRVVVLSAALNKDVFDATLNVLNDLDGPIMIEKDKFKAKRSDGSVADRETSFADKFKKTVFTIAPHTAAEVSLSFKVGHPERVPIVLAGINSGALNLPDLVLEPK